LNLVCNFRCSLFSLYWSLSGLFSTLCVLGFL
jgi:hypothetical protein